MRIRTVKVKIFKILFLHNNMNTFFNLVADRQQDNRIYQNELISSILNEQDYFYQLIATGFLPYLSNFVLMLFYLMYILSVPTHELESVWHKSEWFFWLIRVLIIVLTVY